MPDKYNEKYPRPCFAECKCETHGSIIFADGSRSDEIRSIKQGKAVVEELVTAGTLSKENGMRVVDHLVCSNLPDESPTIEVVLVTILVSTQTTTSTGTPS